MSKKEIKELIDVKTRISYPSWKKLKVMSVNNDMTFPEYLKYLLEGFANKKLNMEEDK